MREISLIEKTVALRHLIRRREQLKTLNLSIKQGFRVFLLSYKAEISVDMWIDTAVRRTASDYDLILNSNELLISVLKIESLGLKF